MAKRGRFHSELKPRFSWVASLVRTVESLVSLPAAAMVSTAPTGIAVMGFSFPE